jgi:hypothetical protein
MKTNGVWMNGLLFLNDIVCAFHTVEFAESYPLPHPSPLLNPLACKDVIIAGGEGSKKFVITSTS